MARMCSIASSLIVPLALNMCSNVCAISLSTASSLLSDLGPLDIARRPPPPAVMLHRPALSPSAGPGRRAIWHERARRKSDPRRRRETGAPRRSRSQESMSAPMRAHGHKPMSRAPPE
eukprot:CAMPEP_0179076160 /NCGR_PEP_ID=MMETSP0796-20121207/33960_1 /TAXON_ID=73915 /ORGANISM="Pyrodinium bahamense, Strain pbaha01" /LENGTH=117 /DNA_ID=CAMNT_0020773409 /DNA_START=444 /DNA_END=795 /DNA_ORIENTATION=+